MPNIIVKPKNDGTYRATQNGRTIATGDTQLEAGAKAHEKKPNDSVIAARVRTTPENPDKFRHLFGPKIRIRGFLQQDDCS
jgi:hypothetical protein